MNSQELLEAVERENIVVFKKNNDDRRQVKLTTGEEAYFAILAQDML